MLLVFENAFLIHTIARYTNLLRFEYLVERRRQSSVYMFSLRLQLF